MSMSVFFVTFIFIFYLGEFEFIFAMPSEYESGSGGRFLVEKPRTKISCKKKVRKKGYNTAWKQKFQCSKMFSVLKLLLLHMYMVQ
jgi:hypothetical protein